MVKPTGDIIVLDIETAFSTDPEKAVLKFFGCYSYSDNQIKILMGNNDASLSRISDLVNSHSVIVGFNIKKFDIPVLKKYNIDFSNKIIIDLWEILAPRNIKGQVGYGGKGRHAIMRLNPKDFTLATILKELKLGEYKKEGFDYKILESPNFTIEQLHLIIEYLKQDIIVTKDLFEYLYNYFYGFRDFISEKDQREWKWLNTSSGAYAYKVICNLAGVKEEYNEDDLDDDSTYEGGFVANPIMERAVGNIYEIDFSSAYPHAYMQHNLYSHSCTCCKEEEKWSGKGIYKLKGKYCIKQMGRIEGVIKLLYKKRKEYKKVNDPREYAIKIVINTLYGISGNKKFKSIYNINTASDCTYIARESLKYARKIFIKEGYQVLYSDTDSCYVLDSFNNKEKLNKIRLDIINNIKEWSLFPQETFDMSFGDHDIKAMFFFKNVNDFVKKMYITIYYDEKEKEEKLKIKGLPIIKGDASVLGVHILNKFLKKQIIQNKECKFQLGYLKQLIYCELEKDINLSARTFKVKDPSSYKSKTALNYKISEYLDKLVEKKELQSKPLAIQLIPVNINCNFGVGEGKKYVLLEEFKKNKLKIKDIDLSKTLSELDPFTKNNQTTINSY